MQSGVRRLTTAAAPHSRILAACQAIAGDAPRINANDAKIAVSLARPARTTSAPAASAAMIGSAPIMPTMCALLSITASFRGGAGSSGTIRPWCSFSSRKLFSCSEWINAILKARPSSAAISRTMSAYAANWVSPPAVPQLPRISEMSRRRAPLSAIRVINTPPLILAAYHSAPRGRSRRCSSAAPTTRGPTTAVRRRWRRPSSGSPTERCGTCSTRAPIPTPEGPARGRPPPSSTFPP